MCQPLDLWGWKLGNRESSWARPMLQPAQPLHSLFQYAPVVGGNNGITCERKENLEKN